MSGDILLNIPHPVSIHRRKMAGPFPSETDSGNNRSGSSTKAVEFDAGKLSVETQNSLRMQASLRSQRVENDRANPNAFDLVGEGAYSMFYAGSQAPVLGVAQLTDRAHITSNAAKTLDYFPHPHEEKFGTARWHAQQIGGALGMTVPFMAARGGLKMTGLSLAAKAETAALSSGRLLSLGNAAVVADGAITGFVADYVGRPVLQGEGDFWEARRNHGLTGAATFAALTAGSVSLRHLSAPLAKNLTGLNKFAYETTLGATSGAPAGVVNADVNALLTQNRFATAEERKQGIYTMMMVGGTLSALHRIPGQEKSTAQLALESQQAKEGSRNLSAMLAKRPISGSFEGVGPEGVRTQAPSADSMLGRTQKGGSSSKALLNEGRTDGRSSSDAVVADSRKSGRPNSDAVVNDALVRGRALASGDRTEIKTTVTPELQRYLQSGAEMALAASEATATPQQVVDFFNFARSKEGAQLRNSMLDVAEQYQDARLLTIVREAYLPIEGMEHRIIPGQMRIEADPGVKVTDSQQQRWAQFVDIIKEPPTDVENYALYRNQVFDWLNKNPDLHNWAKQVARQTSLSNQAAPIDFYFETNILSRFIKVQDGTYYEKPVTLPELATMRRLSQEFAEQVGEKPYDADIKANFVKMIEQSEGVSVNLLAEHINQVLGQRDLKSTAVVGVDGENQITLYRPRTITTVDSKMTVDYNAGGKVPEGTPKPDVEKVNEIANRFVQGLMGSKSIGQAQFLLTDAALNLKELGVKLENVPTELNYILAANRTGFEASINGDGHLQIVYRTSQETMQPLVSVARTREGRYITRVHEAKTGGDQQ
jgi:hypothetical protein